MKPPSHLCRECPKHVARIDWCPILAQRRRGAQPMCAWALKRRMWRGGEPYAPFIREEGRDDGDA